MSATYFKDVDVLLLCYSLDDPQSLEDIPFWNDLFEKHKTPAHTKTIKYLIALKSDTNHDEKERTRKQGKTMAEECGFKYMENVTSMGHDDTVHNVFNTIYEDFRKSNS